MDTDGFLGYFELTSTTPSTEDDKLVADINRLLPQLTTSGTELSLEWLQFMLDSGTRIFLATCDGQVIGTVLLTPMVIFTGQKDWIEDVVVDESFRQRGVASRLMDLAEAASRERGAKNINLTSNPARGNARKMYGDRGYVIRDTGVFRKAF